MKQIICLLALMLVIVVGLGTTAVSNVSPTGSLPGLIDPGEDHPWGGNEFGPSIGSSSPGRVARPMGSTGNLFIDLYFRYLVRPWTGEVPSIRHEYRHLRPTPQGQTGTTTTTIPTQGSSN